MSSNFQLLLVSWQTHSSQLTRVREEVFILEQKVPFDLEWDEFDSCAQHLLVVDELNEPIACARLLENGNIGRMAVLKEWRGRGVGMALLKMAIKLQTQQGIQIIKLSAQTHAIPFYNKADFEVCSKPYLDANIPHVDMRLLVDKS